MNCKKLKFTFKCLSRVLNNAGKFNSLLYFWPDRSGKIMAFSFPDCLKSFATSVKMPPELGLPAPGDQPELWPAGHMCTLLLWESTPESPGMCSPCPPDAAASPPSGLLAPLGSTLTWPAALLLPPPLTFLASSVFLWGLCKQRVTSLSENVSGMQFLAHFVSHTPQSETSFATYIAH